jgi:hypothetical protein
VFHEEFTWWVFCERLDAAQRKAEAKKRQTDGSPSMGATPRRACHVPMRTGERDLERFEIKLAYEDPASDHVQEVS